MSSPATSGFYLGNGGESFDAACARAGINCDEALAGPYLFQSDTDPEIVSALSDASWVGVTNFDGCDLFVTNPDAISPYYSSTNGACALSTSSGSGASFTYNCAATTIDTVHRLCVCIAPPSPPSPPASPPPCGPAATKTCSSNTDFLFVVDNSASVKDIHLNLTCAELLSLFFRCRSLSWWCSVRVATCAPTVCAGPSCSTSLGASTLHRVQLTLARARWCCSFQRAADRLQRYDR